MDKIAKGELNLFNSCLCIFTVVSPQVTDGLMKQRLACRVDYYQTYITNTIWFLFNPNIGFQNPTYKNASKPF